MSSPKRAQQIFLEYRGDSRRHPALACAARCAARCGAALVRSHSSPAGRRDRRRAVGRSCTMPEKVQSAKAMASGRDAGPRPRITMSSAWRFVLAMPFARQAAGEAEAARPGMRRHDPDDGAPRPDPAARQEGFGMIEQGRHGRGQHGVVRARRDAGLLPALQHDARRRVQLARRARMVGDGSIAVHGSARSCSAAPSWPPPAPTSSRSPISGTSRRTCGATRAT